jgi:hypothetical protein
VYTIFPLNQWFLLTPFKFLSNSSTRIANRKGRMATIDFLLRVSRLNNSKIKCIETKRTELNLSVQGGEKY